MSSIKPGRILAGAGILAVTTVGGWLAYSRYGVDHNVPLPNAVDAPRSEFSSERAGRLSYYVDSSGNGTPLLLIHSINAAPSAFEMKPLFQAYRGQRPVIAVDLPGFGFSERTDRVYRPDLYVAAILDLVDREIGQPVDAVALSLGCEFLATAALRRPQHFRSLAFLSPTGLGRTSTAPSSEAAYQFFATPLWSQAFYDLLVTRPSMRFFLNQTFVGDVPPEFLTYSYQTSHQPGARYAPLYFISGQLFTPDILTEVYARLPQPVLALYGYDPNVTFDQLPQLLEQRANWQAVQTTTRLPHWEQLAETVQALDAFWADP
ncbi:MAG: alpha/beta fold hydrolase [Anaerolineae bacterium]